MAGEGFQLRSGSSEYIFFPGHNPTSWGQLSPGSLNLAPYRAGREMNKGKELCVILNITVVFTTPLKKNHSQSPNSLVSGNGINQTTNWVMYSGPWGIFARVEQWEYFGFSSGVVPNTTMSPAIDTMSSCHELGNIIVVDWQFGWELGGAWDCALAGVLLERVLGNRETTVQLWVSPSSNATTVLLLFYSSYSKSLPGFQFFPSSVRWVVDKFCRKELGASSWGRAFSL